MEGTHYYPPTAEGGLGLRDSDLPKDPSEFMVEMRSEPRTSRFTAQSLLDHHMAPALTEKEESWKYERMPIDTQDIAELKKVQKGPTDTIKRLKTPLL